MLHFFAYLLVALAGTYVLLCALLYGLQGRFVFFPTPEVYATPADEGLEFDDLTLASGSAEINAWFVPATDARGTLLLCHGNGGNIAGRVDSVRLFHDLGLNVLIFDYQGYGRSSGRPSESNTYADAEAAWMHLTEDRGIAPESIVILGRSLGGAVAAELAERCTPGALIIESTFGSLAAIAADYYPFLPTRLLARYSYDTLSRLPGVDCPVLIAHSPTDEIVPYHHGRALFEAAREPKEFLEMHGGHNDGYAATGRVYTEAISDFVGKRLGKPDTNVP